MSTARIALLSELPMLAFAGNSLPCRLALEQTRIDAAELHRDPAVLGRAGALILAHASRRACPGAVPARHWHDRSKLRACHAIGAAAVAASLPPLSVHGAGTLYALASGALSSGIGYAI